MSVSSQSQAPAALLPQLSDELRTMLQTRWDEVYELSADGLTYVKPSSLRGVPVAKSGEGSSYWQRGWASLNDYIAGEREQEDMKNRAAMVLSSVPNDERARKEKKLRSDNMSKQKKIREVFGEGRPHPNQLVAPRYLPLEGLCDQETMYRIGCKITDLVVLANRGLLGMDPWDFYRWRVGMLLVSRHNSTFPTRSRKPVEAKNIVHHLDGADGPDPLFREAVMYSAKLQGREASYGPRKRAELQYSQAGRLVRGASSLTPAAGKSTRDPPQHRLQHRLHDLQRPLVHRSTTTSLDRDEFLRRRKADQAQKEREEKERIRADRHSRLIAQSRGYAGVNAFRARRGIDTNTKGKIQHGSGSETAKNDSGSDPGQGGPSRF